MDSSASFVSLNNERLPPPHSPSKLNTYGFAIAIILGIGGLAVAAAGVAGYFHVGALSNMAQINAIIMMAAGGGSGTLLLIVGSVGTIKNRQNVGHEQYNDLDEDSEHDDMIQSDSEEQAEIISPIGTQSGQGDEPVVIHTNNNQVEEAETIAPQNEPVDGIEDPQGTLVHGPETFVSSYDTQGGLVYGPDAWRIWNVEVLDVVPPAPLVDLSKKDKVLLYIPQRIRVDGKEQDLTLNTFKEISNFSLQIFNESTEFGDKSAPGWVLIDKTVIPQSVNKDYETQKKMVEERGCSMPSVLEAVVLNLMVSAFTGEKLYGVEPLTYTRCSETVGYHTFLVGAFSQDNLSVLEGYSRAADACGVACTKRFS